MFSPTTLFQNRVQNRLGVFTALSSWIGFDHGPPWIGSYERASTCQLAATVEHQPHAEIFVGGRLVLADALLVVRKRCRRSALFAHRCAPMAAA